MPAFQSKRPAGHVVRTELSATPDFPAEGVKLKADGNSLPAIILRRAQAGREGKGTGRGQEDGRREEDHRGQEDGREEAVCLVGRTHVERTLGGSFAITRTTAGPAPSGPPGPRR